MTVKKNKRLSQFARELNVGLGNLSEFLQKKGYDVPARPNAKVSAECSELLYKQFSKDKNVKEKSEELIRQKHSYKDESEITEIENTVEQTSENTDNEEEVIDEITENDTVINEDEALEATNQEFKNDETKELEDEKEELLTDNIIENTPEIIEESVEVTEITEKEEETKTSEIEEYNNEDECSLDLNNETEKVTEKEEKQEEKVNKKVNDDQETINSDTTNENEQEEESEEIIAEIENETVTKEDVEEEEQQSEEQDETQNENSKLKLVGKINLDEINQKTKPDRKKTRSERRKERRAREQASLDATEKARLEKQEKEKIRLEEEAKEKIRIEKEEKLQKEKDNFIETKVEKLTGPLVLGKITLKEEKTPKKNTDKKERETSKRRKRRKRIRKPVNTTDNTQNKKTSSKYKKTVTKTKTKEVDDQAVKNQIRDTLAKLTNKKRKTAVKHRKQKRHDIREKIQADLDRTQQEQSILKVTEFISANELAILMGVSVNDVIKTCFELGKMVAINQRLDAEVISIVAEEFNFEVEFVSVSDQEEIEDIVDSEEDLESRSPIVTIMGHVDHGKTSLLDFIRETNVIAGEAGGITQHIGAYSVVLKGGQKITFLDTPGHEAFTAMRARGAKVTDVAVIIVAADDDIMPQTEEAINHAKAADVPIVFAINKIDKDGANPEKIKQALAERNLLIEEWGGTYQSKEISAKQGTNVPELLEEILLASEVLELKANPNRKAKGTVIEASLDKGRGYMTTVLVQTGTLKIGDVILAGSHSGKVKAMFNERDQKVYEAKPSEPVLILGLDGAPQAGDRFNVMETDKEAREIATKYKRLQREQSLRARRHITLDEIGRRIKIGNFQELNVIIKGDVIGSIEALADSFIKLSNEEIQIRVIHKAVGQINEADIMLAAASDAVVIGFQVRPVFTAKKIAEKEEIEIRLYSVIYDAIDDLKAAMEGMLSPVVKEEITATIEVKEVFKISKVGKVAGCMVLEGKMNKDSKVRLIRDGIIIYTGDLSALKRYKDEVKEVVVGMECGLSIKNYQDIKVGDIVEAFTRTETARKL